MRGAHADVIRVYLACPTREHAAPGDGQPEHLDADRLRSGNVPSKAVIEVVSNCACISVEYLACSMFQTRGVLREAVDGLETGSSRRCTWLGREGIPYAGTPPT